MPQTAVSTPELRQPDDAPLPVPAHTAFRYMARFQCIGAACETTCCKGWEIQVDEPHYKKLKKTMARSEAERQKFDAGHRMVRGSDRSRGKFALVVLQPNGDCSYLQSDSLCSLQTTYGEEALSDTCAVYPRAVSQSGSRQELSGAVSCPEVARQLLLHEDAMDLVAADGGSFSRGMISQSIASPPPT
ncbi:MAG: flagellin lysine-N-methylase, partial [Polyangiaceae bacterium]